MDFTAVDLLAGVKAYLAVKTAPFSAALSDWLSMTAIVGEASRPSVRRPVLNTFVQVFSLAWRNQAAPRPFLKHCDGTLGEPMRMPFATSAILAASLSTAAFAQEPKLAPEGRGLLPRPPAATREAPAVRRFSVDPSGGLSRTIFETDEDPNFRIVIRDFSFLPDKQPHALTLPSAAVLQLLSGNAEISVAKQRMELTNLARTPPVPAGAPIEVVTSGEYPVVVRALIVEAK
jgi:hypothetical protein